MKHILHDTRQPTARVALPQRGAQQRVLLATGFGGELWAQEVHLLLAAALRARGADVHVLLCDGVLPACALCRLSGYLDIGHFLREGPGMARCAGCFRAVREAFEGEGATVHTFSARITTGDRVEAATAAAGLPIAALRGYRLDGISIGMYAEAAAREFFAKPSLGDAPLDDEPHVEAILRRYFHAALLTRAAISRLLAVQAFDVVVSQQVSALPQRLILKVCARAGLRVVGWWTKFRRDCVMFGEDGFTPMLAAEDPSLWEAAALTPEMEARLDDYLERRAHGVTDWTARPMADCENGAALAAELGLRPDVPMIGLVPNLRWDVSTDESDVPFRDIREWVLATIAYFAGRPDLQLVIRLHPHRVDVSRLAAQVITEAFPSLPDNVVVVPGDHPVNTYAIMAHCDTVLIWASTTGLELVARGIPVVVAGDGWVKGKGFTMDARSASEYWQLLDALPLRARCDAPTVERARRCAYHFFFRHMIPLGEVDELAAMPATLRGPTRRRLLERGHHGLDVICRGILDGEPFLARV